VSDKGTSTSVGAGVRVGWTGKVLPGVSLGATWASKVKGKFDEYKGLFANGGEFDVPENYAVGVAVQPSSDWSLGADVQTIRYSKVAAVGNSIAGLLQGTPLGAANGPGFGWRDLTVVKLAAAYKVDTNLTVRGGYSHARQPVPAGETFFNILAPGVLQDHFTLGATLGNTQPNASGGEWSGFLAYAPSKTISGSNSIPPGFPPGGFGGGNANIRLKETIIGVSYGWKL
jgi:long-chain fatty acid transport protein